MRHSFFRLAGLGAVALSVSIPFAAFADEIPPEVPVETHFNLTVIKQVVQHEGGTAVASDFAIQISGGGGSYSNSFAGSESGVTDTHVPLGSYSVSEAPQTGFEASYSEGCSGTAVTDGEDVTCTVTNTELPATLTVTKVVVNDDGGEASVEDFPLYVGETSVSSGEENEFDPGTYTISEENETDYVGTFSGDCDSQGHITLTAGQNATCTITNDDPEPPPTTGTLIVKKHVVNDNQGTKGAGDFTIRVYRPGRELTLGAFHLAISAPTTEYEFTSFEGSEEGTPLVMSPGDYRVQEDETDGYTASYSGDCEGSIAAGETKTCEITNDDAGTASNGKGGLGSGDSIPGPTPVYQTSGGSGSGSGDSNSNTGSGSGSSNQGGDSMPPAGRVLGDEEVNTTLGACVLDEADAALIVPDADQMTAMQHLVRNLSLESRYRALVQGVLPRDAQADAREAAINFGIYGTPHTAGLGIGERAGVLSSYGDAYRALPSSDCEWQDVVRIATGKHPVKQSTERETRAHAAFLRVYGRADDAANANDANAISMMAYGVRPLARSLDAERAAIRAYREVFGALPRTSFEWDTVRAIAYSGLR